MLNARLRRGGLWLRALLACALGLVAAGGLLVAARTELTSLRYELGRLQEREATLGNHVEVLHVETEALRAPEQVRPRALALGMVYPQPGQVIALPPASVAAGAMP